MTEITEEYRRGLRDASLYVRRHKDKTHDLIACDLEDKANTYLDPEKCSHPFWRIDAGKEVCRSCGADVSHIDPMGG